MSIFDKASLMKKPQMFFGDGHFIQEFLTPAYPWALRSADRQNAQDWAWDEFSLKLDAAQLATANNAIRHIFTSNLQSQIFADTVQGRGPSWLIQYVSDPALEYAFTQWARFECFTPDHEYITKDGTVAVKDVSLNDEILQWDSSTGEISYVKPEMIIQKPYDGYVYTLKGETISQVVTAKHRIPTVIRENEIRTELAEDLDDVIYMPTLDGGREKVTVSKTLYDGFVYCVSVPSTYVVVQHEGKQSISGNCLHSRTYTNILTSMYPNPRIVLDMIEQKPEVFARFSQCVKAYDEFFEIPTKENLLILVAAINILEGLSFYASFICNFAFANMGLFESVAKYLKQIAKDEALHLGITQQIIKGWRTGKEGKEWKDLWNKNKDRIRQMYVDAVHEEYSWSSYLFQYGTPIVGLNEEILNKCIEYYANKRMKNIGLKEFNNVNKDPLPWVQTKYLSNSGFQDAPQEVSITAYFKDSISRVETYDEISNLFKDHVLVYGK